MSYNYSVIECTLYDWTVIEYVEVRILSCYFTYHVYRIIKHTHKNKDRVTRTPLKTVGELMWSERVSSSCSTSATRRVNLVTNPFKLCGDRH
jgi:hypothetical protein